MVAELLRPARAALRSCKHVVPSQSGPWLPGPVAAPRLRGTNSPERSSRRRLSTATRTLLRSFQSNRSGGETDPALSSIGAPTPASGAPRAVPTGPLRDERIPASVVRFVDPETDSLSAPMSLSRLLSTIDRKRYWAVQVKPAEPDSDQPERRHAIVRLVDKKEAYARDKAKAQAKKAGKGDVTTSAGTGSSAAAHKEVQLTWFSTQHDASHKLAQGRAHLWKKGVGAKVSVVVTSKKEKGGSRLDAARKQAFLDMVQEQMLRTQGQEDGGAEAEADGGADVAEDGDGEAAKDAGGAVSGGDGGSKGGAGSLAKLMHVQRKGEPEWQRPTTVVVAYEMVKGPRR